MLHTYKQAFCALALISVIGCSASLCAKPSQIEEIRFSSYDSQINIEFAQPMTTWFGAGLGKAVRVVGYPDVNCFWESDTEISCRREGDKELPAASEFKLLIGEGLYTAEGEALSASQHTVYSNRPSANVRSIQQENGRAVFWLESELPTTLQSVQQSLSVTLNGAEQSFRIEAVADARDNNASNKKYQVAVDVSNVNDALLEYRMHPGFRSTSGPLTSVKTIELGKLYVNEPFRLRSAACANNDKPVNANTLICPAGDQINLLFSAKPSDASLDELKKRLGQHWQVSLKDWFGAQGESSSIGISSQHRTRPVVLSVVAMQAGMEFPLSALQVLRDDQQRSLSWLDFILRSGDFRPSYRLPSFPAVLPVDVDARRFSNVIQYINQKKSTEFQWRAYLSSYKKGVLSVPASAKQNAYERIALPISNDLFRTGGFVRFSGPDKNAETINVAAFNMLVHKYEDQLLVWATDWRQAQPVVNARIELLDLSSESKVLASSYTDKDGVARIHYESLEESLAKKQLLVRASHAGKYSTMVMEYSGYRKIQDRNSEHQYYYGEGSQAVVQYGAVDKPVYRAGEIVKYRLWFRERNRNQLIQRSRSFEQLHFVSQLPHQLLTSWSLKTDYPGSTHGEFRLPKDLNDGYYCIVASDKIDSEVAQKESEVDWEDAQPNSGACMYVGRVQSQTLKTELSDLALRELDNPRIAFRGNASYYSGGVAANIDLKINVDARARSISALYPQYRSYRFAGPAIWDDNDEVRVNFTDSFEPNYQLDADGSVGLEADLSAPLQELISRSESPAWIDIDLQSSVKLPGQAEAVSGLLTASYTPHSGFIGLKRNYASKRLQFDVLLIDTKGKALENQRIQVQIFPVKTWGEDISTLSHTHECEVTSSKTNICDFKPAKPGLFAVIASKNGYASVRLDQYLGSEAWTYNEDENPVRLQVLKHAKNGRSASVRVEQPHSTATALFVLNYMGVRKTFSRALSVGETVIDIPVNADWAPAVTLQVFVRPRELSSDAVAMTIDTGHAETDIQIERELSSPPLQLQTSKAVYKPGEKAQITLKNNSLSKRYVTLTVVDDSIYQQMGDFNDRYRPEHGTWLGVLNEWGNGQWYGFPTLSQQFVGPVSYGCETCDLVSLKELDTVMVMGSRINRRAMEESAQPVYAVTREQNAADGFRNAADVIGQLTDTDGSALSTVITHPREKPRPPTNSSISLRSWMADTAYWNPSIVLNPGDSIALDVSLPGNFAQWRVLAWSNDGEMDFALQEYTFTSGQEVEVYAGLPAFLYQDDQSSANINVRNATDSTTSITLDVLSTGAVEDKQSVSVLKVEPSATWTHGWQLQPKQPGLIDIRSTAVAGNYGDALQSILPIYSRSAEFKRLQAGWLDEAKLSLPLPKTPGLQGDAKMQISVSQDLQPWTKIWIDDLHSYPHRCLEQTLSRAIGAEMALRSGYAKEHWPDAESEIRDALLLLPSFKRDDGFYVYFRDDSNDLYRDNADLSSVALTAYVLLALDAMPDHQHWLAAGAREDIVDTLKDWFDEKDFSETKTYVQQSSAEVGAMVASVIKLDKPETNAQLSHLFAQRQQLSWYSRSRLLNALAKIPKPDDRRDILLMELRNAAALRGQAAVVEEPRLFESLMGSRLRNQCAVAEALYRYDTNPDYFKKRISMIRGVLDLYAGGNQSADTQSNVFCLMALQAVQAAKPSSLENEQAVSVSVGEQSRQLVVSNDAPTANSTIPVPKKARTLDITNSGALSDYANYSAQIRYVADQTNAEPTALGIQLEREYQIFRTGVWHKVERTGIRDGDWVRVRLRVNVPSPRHFVALTDFVPAGLMTRDVSLQGVAPVEIAKAGLDSSWYFTSRRTDVDKVYLYATYLPAGSHDAFYYTQATQSGNFFAMPAIAELMYGRNTRATTSSDTLVIKPAEQ
jgi:uncharacterized protein YfaS (alpha-2-macroglobulin family)